MMNSGHAKILTDLKRAYHLEELALETLALFYNTDEKLEPLCREDRLSVQKMLTEIEGDERRHTKMLDSLIAKISR